VQVSSKNTADKEVTNERELEIAKDIRVEMFVLCPFAANGSYNLINFWVPDDLRVPFCSNMLQVVYLRTRKAETDFIQQLVHYTRKISKFSH
jgi:hypothetical protein